METTMYSMLSYIFYLVRSISYEKWLSRLFTPDGTDPTQWLIVYPPLFPKFLDLPLLLHVLLLLLLSLLFEGCEAAGNLRNNTAVTCTYLNGRYDLQLIYYTHVYASHKPNESSLDRMRHEASNVIWYAPRRGMVRLL
jgi:hypothetical protein